MKMLTVDGISKRYGSVQALDGVSLQVEEGSVYGLLGPNGSGKTTLLSIILDVLSADSGQYRWFDATGTPDIRKRIGALLETPNFYHYLSGTDNLQITHAISGRGSREEIDRVLEIVSLTERKNSRFSTYSLGMKQRLAIAGTLLGSPPVLVLDEPTNGLDPVGIAEIRSLIGELRKKGHTIIIASHLLDEVEKICTHVAILKKGKVLVEGPVEDVLSDEDQVELKAANLDALAALLAHFPGVVRVSRQDNLLLAHFEKGKANLEALNRSCFEQGISLAHLVLKKKKLEERFFELTGNTSHA